jgi:hypothetical protein
MVQTNNPFKGLGKCFYFSLDSPGFVNDRELPEKSVAKKYDGFSKYNPNAEVGIKMFINNQTLRHPMMHAGGFDALESLVHIGKDYKGSLELPKGTEAVQIYETRNGEQVIHYCHTFKEPRYGATFLVPFTNEFRSIDKRVNIQDLVPDVPEEQLIPFQD